MGWDIVDWIYLVQDSNRWRAVVSTVMAFGFHKRRGICLAERLQAS
jgi:hypothetical protein